MPKKLILDNLLAKQKLLMARVPHAVRPDAAIKMHRALKIIDTLMRYLNSIGHKPWRPEPLAPTTRQKLLKELCEQVCMLGYIHSTNVGAGNDYSKNELDIRKMVSALGVIEESVEYMNSVFGKDTEEHKLEELVDVYFFLLEQTAMSGFSLEQIEAEYHRKWAVNIKRYEDGKKGDYSWDKREEGEL